MTDLLLDRLDDPARDAAPDPVSAARMDAALDRLLAHPAPARPRRRGLAVATLATAACAAGVLAALPGGSTEAVRIDDASASAALASLQRAATATPAAEGRFAYRKVLRYTTHMRPRPSGEGSYAVVLPHVEEAWIAADGSGVVRSVIQEDQPAFPTPEDRADYEASEQLPFPPEMSEPYALEDLRIAGLTPAEIAALPTDPAGLRARLTQDPRVELAEAAELLSSAVTPPEVRAGLFAMLRERPDATLERDLEDPRGRRGLGITFSSEAWRTTFLFDAGDGTFLGSRSVGRKELPGRETTDWALVLETTRTDDAPAASPRSVPRRP